MNVNFFELFHLPVTFTIDQPALDLAYREVQGQVHPDRFASASDAEKRVAMQWAATANQAYQVLKKPLSRAEYLLGLNGVEVGLESNTRMPIDFLMEQMSWRESLESAIDAKSMSALDALNETVGASHQQLLSALATQLAAPADLAGAALTVRKLHFLQKLDEEISAAYDRLLD